VFSRPSATIIALVLVLIGLAVVLLAGCAVAVRGIS
jgi:hypothetical protein